MHANGRGWYEGAFVMGKQKGPALRVFANHNRYDGSFENNEPEGEGIMEYANGDGNRRDKRKLGHLPCGVGLFLAHLRICARSICPHAFFA
jgi:hypothetical protein